MRRVSGRPYANHDANFYDVDTDEAFWLSGPKRNQTDARYSRQMPHIDEDVRAEYLAFLDGAPLAQRSESH